MSKKDEKNNETENEKRHKDTIALYNRYLLAISSFFVAVTYFLIKEKFPSPVLKISLSLFILSILSTLIEVYFAAYEFDFRAGKKIKKENICHSISVSFERLAFISVILALILLIVFLFTNF